MHINKDALELKFSDKNGGDHLNKSDYSIRCLGNSSNAKQVDQLENMYRSAEGFLKRIKIQ